ncbi:uncharacterized protein LOC106159688 [Lingula anatina]|uniref:Uncharacterized protein LOC106159688 n=1 Tax=Lingula anatina TaxID=7574 RepID=A0A1S3I117_LINAN|nr:uncharacterized protein LOC106159688 [Lingula anatina]|eukprot:XP_013391521.1 uncharacterized protein LOC106159688 [Lingula anatina]
MELGHASLTVNELKRKLLECGALTTGRKCELIERLDAYERNANFSEEPIFVPKPDFVEWPNTGFKTLRQEHSEQLPAIFLGPIEGYFLHHQVAERTVKDIKALEKGRRLLQSNRILTVSVCFNKPSTFLTGIVRAAMKKKVSYNIKLKLGNQGEPVNSHCECPGGMGPHGTCKHVASVLLLLVQLTSTGELALTGSCTDVLQTFHKPKKAHTGSPKKAHDIGGSADHRFQDPRPAKYRNKAGYNDYVRNLTFHFTSVSRIDVATRYAYPKANLQAAVMDHDYCQVPWTEYIVDRGNDVEEQAAKDIERSTVQQGKSAIWHKEREWRITASRFGEITAATEKRDMNKLCESLLTPKPLHTPAIRHGQDYEKIAIRKFEESQNLKVEQCGLFICLEAPYLGATPDGLIGVDGILEVKCPYKGRNMTVGTGPNFPFIECVSGAFRLKKTHKYYAQVQGQLFITKRSFCYFVVFTFKDLFVELIHSDTEYFSTCILPRLTLFYEKHYRKYVAASL